MGIINFVKCVLGKRESMNKAPFVMISKDPDIIEYDSIEAAISELEKDPSVPKDKMEKVRASFEILKNKGKIKIKNGEIIE